ncbi:MAG TPA: PaaI family thioesterase [Armatimonadota bacterium]
MDSNSSARHDTAFIADRMCFACGPDNPVGLKLTFHQEGDVYVTTFVADRVYQGYECVVHGGIMVTLLDEVMARYVWEKAGPAATARLEVSFRRPAPTGQRLEIRGWITGIRRGGRVYETAALARLEDGTVLAEATGLVLVLSGRTGG